eukprot:4526434-Pyramimonas_sp.AAC.1
MRATACADDASPGGSSPSARRRRCLQMPSSPRCYDTSTRRPPRAPLGPPRGQARVIAVESCKLARPFAAPHRKLCQ